MRQQGQRLRVFMLCTSFPKISWTRMRLDHASTPLKLVLLTVLDLCLFMPDPRLMNALMLWTSFNTPRKGHVDSRKVFS